MVLLIVVVFDKEVYGVVILKNLEKEMSKKFNISVIYVVLKWMEEKGFVEFYYGGIINERGGWCKKYYLLIVLGKKIFDE